MMKDIVLHGSLAEHLPAELNGRFRCDFTTAVEASSALNANFPGFHDKIRDMELYVVDGDANNVPLDERQATTYHLGGDELHFIPAIGGEGGRAGKAILGTLLIAVAIIGTMGAGAGLLGGLGTAAFGNSLGITGTTLLLSGASMVFAAMARPPEAPKETDGKQSVVYTGPLNTQTEGEPVPYTAGRRVFAGGIILHTDLIITNEMD